MAITEIDPAPARNTPEFKTWVEAMMETALPLLSQEIEATILAMNTNDLRGTSTTSYTPNSGGIGVNVFTTQSGKSWLPGQWVTIGYTSDGREYAAGVVQAYSSTSLTVDVKRVSGHGTARTSWQIALSPPLDLFEESEVVVHTANGYGSGGKIRRYTTVHSNIGTGITYADSATDGASFTINTPGDYKVFRVESYAGVSCVYGASLNASNLNTPVGSLTFAERIFEDFVYTGANTACASRIIKCAVADIIRPQDSALLTSTSPCYMAVRRIR